MLYPIWGIRYGADLSRQLPFDTDAFAVVTCTGVLTYLDPACGVLVSKPTSVSVSGFRFRFRFRFRFLSLGFLMRGAAGFVAAILFGCCCYLLLFFLIPVADRLSLQPELVGGGGGLTGLAINEERGCPFLLQV